MLLAFTAMHSCAQNIALIFSTKRSCAVPGLSKNIDQVTKSNRMFDYCFFNDVTLLLIYNLRNIDYSNHHSFMEF